MIATKRAIGLKNAQAIVLLGCTCVWSLHAKVTLNGLFGENMVLQQNARIPIWGTAQNGEAIGVELNGEKASTVANDKGEWKVALGPFPAGGPYELRISGTNRIVINNVLIGEVWLCSGQSNMSWFLINSLNGKEETDKADYPQIRLFHMGDQPEPEPKKFCSGRWDICSPQTAGNFSGVAYFFARELCRRLNVPVGLIDNSVGGTPAEAWMSMEALRADPDFRPIIEHYENSFADFTERKRTYNIKVADYLEARKKAGAKDDRTLRAPWPPFGPGHKQSPSGLYNGKVYPLIPYAIRGVIWYQGENSADRAYQYRKLFPALIKNWRQDWGQGDFPFLFVQLAAYGRYPKTWSCPELREAQLLTWKSVPNTGMAVAVDIGEKNNAHPKNKQDVGLRLGLIARALVYGENLVYSGPIYDSMKIEAGRICLTFKHVGGGLKAKDGELKGFAIAGADRQFVPARAEIAGRTVVVFSETLKNPVAVRYAWNDFPECNLYNKENLPASPFRTDDWPAVTANVLEPSF